MTQNDRVYEYMQTHGSITPKEALNVLGCMRLGARIYELRHGRGINIAKTTEAATNRYGDKIHYARYFIQSDGESEGKEAAI